MPQCNPHRKEGSPSLSATGYFSASLTAWAAAASASEASGMRPGMHGEEPRPRRKIAARGITGDRKTIGVHGEIARVRLHPLECGKAIVHCRRERMFGRQSVVDRDDATGGFIGKRSA